MSKRNRRAAKMHSPIYLSTIVKFQRYGRFRELTEGLCTNFENTSICWEHDAARTKQTRMAGILSIGRRLTANAFNRDNIKTADAALVVTGSPSLKRRGTAYVLSVGTDQYANPDYNLKFAVAAQLRVQQQKVGATEKVEVISLLDTEATKENVLLAFKRLASSDLGTPPGAPEALNKLQHAQPEDEVFIYFAGHGATTAQRFHLIPHDLGYTGSRAGWIRRDSNPSCSTAFPTWISRTPWRKSAPATCSWSSTPAILNKLWRRKKDAAAR